MRYLAFFLFLIALPASAGWEKYAETDEAVFYNYPPSIRANGDYVKILEVIDLKRRSSDGAMSIGSHNEYDCRNNRHRTLSSASFSRPMTEGKVIYQNLSSREWSYPERGTIGFDALRAACKVR
jgi:hypothetical protein